VLGGLLEVGTLVAHVLADGTFHVLAMADGAHSLLLEGSDCRRGKRRGLLVVGHG
jgi:hypothetical protein